MTIQLEEGISKEFRELVRFLFIKGNFFYFDSFKWKLEENKHAVHDIFGDW